MAKTIPIFHKKVNHLYNKCMDAESRKVIIFFTFVAGGAIGFYLAKFYLPEILTLIGLV